MEVVAVFKVTSPISCQPLCIPAQLCRQEKTIGFCKHRQEGFEHLPKCRYPRKEALPQLGQVISIRRLGRLSNLIELGNRRFHIASLANSAANAEPRAKRGVAFVTPFREFD